MELENGIYWIDVWNYRDFDLDYSDENSPVEFAHNHNGYYFVVNNHFDGPYTQQQSIEKLRLAKYRDLNLEFIDQL